METRNEKWESLRVSTQKFSPQEYIGACWVLRLHCIGQTPSEKNGNMEHWVFTYPADGSTYLGEVLHSEHDIDAIYAKTEDDNPPTEQFLIDYLGEFHAALASDEATNHNPRQLHPGKVDDYTVGYAWAAKDSPYIGQYHFVKVLDWQYRNQTAS